MFLYLSKDSFDDRKYAICDSVWLAKWELQCETEPPPGCPESHFSDTKFPIGIFYCYTTQGNKIVKTVTEYFRGKCRNLEIAWRIHEILWIVPT